MRLFQEATCKGCSTKTPCLIDGFCPNCARNLIELYRKVCQKIVDNWRKVREILSESERQVLASLFMDLDMIPKNHEKDSETT